MYIPLRFSDAYSNECRNVILFLSSNVFSFLPQLICVAHIGMVWLWYDPIMCTVLNEMCANVFMLVCHSSLSLTNSHTSYCKINITLVLSAFFRAQKSLLGSQPLLFFEFLYTLHYWIYHITKLLLPHVWIFQGGAKRLEWAEIIRDCKFWKFPLKQPFFHSYVCVGIQYRYRGGGYRWVIVNGLVMEYSVEYSA